MANYKADFENGVVNPYNFVSLGGSVKRGKLKVGNRSGVIHCKLITTTPLAMPDFPLETKNEDDHKSTDFFKVDGKAVIPGSEIRGVIRSAYETLSNSCLSVNNNNILSARSADVRKPGIIKYGSDKKWHLYKATTQKLKYDGSDDFDETADTFKRKWRNYRYKNRRADYASGKVEVNYKFSTTFDEVKVEDLDRSIKDYKECCKIYKDNDKQIERYISNISPDGKCYTVYYKKFRKNGKDYVYLSPAQISRSVFKNKLDDLLGEHSHCTDPEFVCDACGLFGMIGTGSNKLSAIASRVRFTDAKITTKPRYIKATLKELSSPKISSVEFYSKVPDMKYLWTYDSNGVILNGRKYYFHHISDCSTSDKTKRNITTELLDKGAEFEFDVYFDKITNDELEKIIWTIAIGENSTESNQQHKIGYGKPLGLGSVKMVVDSVETRTFDRETMEYTCQKADVDSFFDEIPFDSESEYFKEYMCITDFTYVKDRKVAYPYGDNGKGNPKTSTGTLVWFKANHNDGKTVNDKDRCSIAYHLPKITDKERLILPNLTKDKNTSGNSNTKPSNNRNSGRYEKNKTVFRSVSDNGGFSGGIRIIDKRKGK